MRNLDQSLPLSVVVRAKHALLFCSTLNIKKFWSLANEKGDQNSCRIRQDVPVKESGSKIIFPASDFTLTDFRPFLVTTVVDVGSLLVFFRFRSKSNQWLLMKVILRVTYNPMTSKPEYFNANLTLATWVFIYRFFSSLIKAFLVHYHVQQDPGTFQARLPHPSQKSLQLLESIFCPNIMQAFSIFKI